MKRRNCLCVAVVLLLSVFVSGTSALAQTDDTVEYQINALRSDLKADKAEIVNQAMQLKAEDAKKFWPVYKEYDKELSQVNDDLVQLIKSYAQKYGSITDADARDLTLKAFDYQAKKTELKRKYFDSFSKAVSPLTAAKFFQLEYRLELLFNLKLASELPVLLFQAAPPRSDAAAQKRD